MPATKKILIVDDEPDIREVLHMILELEGFEIYELDNGQGVAGMVHELRPDIILLDVMLGDADGRDICQALKKNKNTSDIPVVIISATHGSENSDGKSCGADDFITKPFDIFDLVLRVKKQIAA